MRAILKTAAINSLLATAYIAGVALFLFSASESKWGQMAPSVFIPIVMLMLFVFSATVTAWLILGRPLMWYLDGQKKDALQLLKYTIGCFFVLLLLAFGLLMAKGTIPGYDTAMAYCNQPNVATASTNGKYIRVISSLPGGGSAYYPVSGGEAIRCPVVSPEYQSAECKGVFSFPAPFVDVCTNTNTQ